MGDWVGELEECPSSILHSYTVVQQEDLKSCMVSLREDNEEILGKVAGWVLASPTDLRFHWDDMELMSRRLLHSTGRGSLLMVAENSVMLPRAENVFAGLLTGEMAADKLTPPAEQAKELLGGFHAVLTQLSAFFRAHPSQQLDKSSLARLTLFFYFIVSFLKISLL